jgi:hypothetical protein
MLPMDALIVEYAAHVVSLFCIQAHWLKGTLSIPTPVSVFPTGIIERLLRGCSQFEGSNVCGEYMQVGIMERC